MSTLLIQLASHNARQRLRVETGNSAQDKRRIFSALWAIIFTINTYAKRRNFQRNSFLSLFIAHVLRRTNEVVLP